MIEPIQNPTEEELARWHRTFAPKAFNYTWSLLDLNELTREQEEEMLAATMAQRHHWYQIGTARNRAIADWQVSRVLAVIGYEELSRRFGERSLAVAIDNELDAFVVGFAYEAIARAAASVDDVATFEESLSAARAQMEKIEDEDDRAVLKADLDQFDSVDHQ